MKKAISLVLSNCFALVVFCQSGEVVIAGSQMQEFTSSIVQGQEYVLQISLPAGYGKSEKKYPVVYLMDSQWDFPLLTALYGEQYFDGSIPELIIVGITWGGANNNPDSLRARDYTPTNEKRLPQSGGADQFLSVIKKEIFPFVENHYKTDTSNRTLVGCSLGGLFTLYTLFTHASMFNRYIAASPAYTWDKNILNQYEEKYHSATDNPPAKLYMCVGGVELNAPGFSQFASFLANRHYPSLVLESEVLENTGHSGTKGEGYSKGLQSVFKRPSVILTPAVLQQYSGRYTLSNGSVIEIKTENDSLAAVFGNSIFKFHCASEKEFYLNSSFCNLSFVKDDQGNILGFHLLRYGLDVFATKEK
jgi:predicted alpha/beta superfamily hydrolase